MTHLSRHIGCFSAVVLLNLSVLIILSEIDSSDLPSDVQDTLNKAVQGGQNLLNSMTGGAGSAAASSLSILGFSMMALWVAL